MVHRCLMESLLDQAGIFPSIAEKLCGLMNDIRQHKEEHGLAVGSQSFFHVGKEAALELLELVGVHRVDLTHTEVCLVELEFLEILIENFLRPQTSPWQILRI